jgi:RNA-directed DNA polymerase
MYFDFSAFAFTPKHKPSSYQLRMAAEQFIALREPEMLAKNLCVPLGTLKESAEKPRYVQFYLPKPNGDQRLIESAEKPLRIVQKHLQQRLQAVYFSIRPACAYGGLLTPQDEPHVRNIYTNAMQHIGKKWLLNFDLKDFFTNIRSTLVFDMLLAAPFHFPEPLAQLISRLVTHEDRLPQGASTSPVISNLICLGIDRNLEALAAEKGWTYTRFIDDMTFSGKKRFKEKQVEAIRQMLESEGFIVNMNKLRIERVKDEPEVTGLVLGERKPDVSAQFLRDLQGEVTIYKALADNPHVLQTFNAQSLQKYKLQVLGKLNFLRFIRGDRHRSFLKLQGMMG